MCQQRLIILIAAIGIRMVTTGQVVEAEQTVTTKIAPSIPAPRKIAVTLSIIIAMDRLTVRNGLANSSMRLAV